jgi:hypothetical protein
MPLRKWIYKKHLYVTSWLNSKSSRELFRDVERFCMFVGYMRSGHSLVGSLLDAHPNMIIAHEMDALRCLKIGCSKDQIFYLLLRNSQKYAQAGRAFSGYAYEVPNQWQGRYSELRVIGDKKGGGSVVHIQKTPHLIRTFQQCIAMEMKFIHVIRNPYDIVSTMTMRHLHRPAHRRRTLEDNIRMFFGLCETIDNVKRQIDPKHMSDVKLESLIEEPKDCLQRLCSFLGLETTDDYLRDCASIVFKSPRTTRQKVPWTKQSIQSVKEQMSKYSFLDGYSFEDGISNDQPLLNRRNGSA